jgi:hypothetical protein
MKERTVLFYFLQHPMLLHVLYMTWNHRCMLSYELEQRRSTDGTKSESKDIETHDAVDE